MNRSVLKLVDGFEWSSRRRKRNEADFYGMIIGVRSRSHSLKGMKLKLKAIRERMRCVVFRFLFKDISFLCLRWSERTLSRIIFYHKPFKILPEWCFMVKNVNRLMSVSLECLRVTTLIITNPIETEDLTFRCFSEFLFIAFAAR